MHWFTDKITGGYQYPWSSAHVLAPLILGVALLVGFFVWETYGAKFPMFPKRLRQEPRILGLTLVITFISGTNPNLILKLKPLTLCRCQLLQHLDVLAYTGVQCKSHCTEARQQTDR
jgi:hypothetical protein